MTGGDAYKQKLLTDDALDAAIAAYLADPSKAVVLAIDRGSLDVAGAVLALLAVLTSGLSRGLTALKIDVTDLARMIKHRSTL